jgi:hypothetical protein
MHNAKDTTASSDARNEFRLVEVIRDPDGVVAVISERVKDGRISFMIAREFDQNGAVKRSAYLARRHLAAAARLLSELGERLELAEDRARARQRDRRP